MPGLTRDLFKITGADQSLSLALVLVLSAFNWLLIEFSGTVPLLDSSYGILKVLCKCQASLSQYAPDGYLHPAVFINRYFEFLHCHDRFFHLLYYFSR